MTRVPATVPKVSPNWTRDELILALDLYFRCDFVQTPKTTPDTIALSHLLQALPIHPIEKRPGNFRNPDGVYMKLCNFLALDPAYGGVGLDAGSKLDADVWDEFSRDRERLRALAEAIRTGAADLADLAAEEPEDDSAPEGRILLRWHRSRERKGSLTEKKKRHALERNGVLRCEVCDLVYAEVYGALGEGFMECHHGTPLAQLRPGQRTRLADLHLVCANCHRMLHRGGDAVSMDQLRAVVADHAPASQ